MQRPIDIAIQEAYRLGSQSTQTQEEQKLDVDYGGVALLDLEKIEDRKRHLVHLFGAPVELAFSAGREDSQTK